jgi:PAS domain S-box-containing protein
MTAATVRILVIDDELGIRDLLRSELTVQGYRVDTAENGEEGLNYFRANHCEIVIADIKMPKIDGLQVLRAIKSLCPETEVIMLTGYATVETAVHSMREGAYDFIEKPFNIDELSAIVEKAAERRELRTLVAKYESNFKELWDNAPVAYHTLDRKGSITRVNQTEAKLLGYTVEEMLGRPIFDFILPEQRDDAKERFLLKIEGRDPDPSGARLYVKRDGTKIYVSIDDVLEKDGEGNVIGVRTTMVDVTERTIAEDGLKKSVEKLEKTMQSIIQAMAKIVEMKDPYTAGHQRRVAQLATAIAREMGLAPDKIDGLHMAATIHDIGKIYVPAEILCKPGRLTENEFGMIKAHAKVSYDILKMVEFPWPIAEIVIQHHERLDSSGYPLGISGDGIRLEAKILSVADVVEAIAFHRPYRSAVGIEKALEEISDNRGTLYDPEVVDTCLKLFREVKFKFDSPAN